MFPCTQASVAFDGLPKTCPIASPLLVVLVANRVFAFWVGNCQSSPIRDVCPNSPNQQATDCLPSCPPFHHFGCVFCIYNHFVQCRCWNTLYTVTFEPLMQWYIIVSFFEKVIFYSTNLWQTNKIVLC